MVPGCAVKYLLSPMIVLVLRVVVNNVLQCFYPF